MSIYLDPAGVYWFIHIRVTANCPRYFYRSCSSLHTSAIELNGVGGGAFVDLQLHITTAGWVSGGTRTTLRRDRDRERKRKKTRKKTSPANKQVTPYAAGN